MSTIGANRPRGASRRELASKAGDAIARLVPRGERVLVGVSGGPDSTALLSALAESAPRLDVALRACIVDHGIREAEEVEGDIARTRELCAGFGVPLDVRRVRRGELAREARSGRRSLEEVARRKRLALLSEAADAAGCGVIALGHTLDDALETVLMRLLSGAGPAGLAGIRPRRGRIVRPLLGVSRREVIAYLAARGLAFRSDSSNADPRFVRNRIRRLVPLLDEAVPWWRSGLPGLARTMARVNDHLRSEASRMGWRRSAGGWEIERREFFGAHPAVRAHALLALADAIRRAEPGRAGSPPEPRIPLRFLEPALRGNPPRSRGLLLRGHALELSFDRQLVRWGAAIASPMEKGYLTVVSRDGRYPTGRSGAVVEVRVSTDIIPGEAAINAREIDPPLAVRSRRRGDAIACGAGERPSGRVPLKDLFDDWGIPERDRWRVPVVVDRRGIVAALGTVVGGKVVSRSADREQAGPEQAGGSVPGAGNGTAALAQAGEFYILRCASAPPSGGRKDFER